MNIKHGLFFSFAILISHAELHASAPFASNPTQNFLKAVDSYASPEELEVLFQPINVDAVNRNGDTPLMIFCRRGNQACVASMLAKNANPNAQHPDHGYTALHVATSSLEPEIMKLLLQAGAHPNMQNSLGNTALHCCMEKHEMEKSSINRRETANRMAQTLIAHPATNLDLTTTPREGGKTALMLACSNGNNLILRAFLTDGADIFIADSNGDDVIALMEKKIAAEKNVELAEKYIGMKEQLQCQRNEILRITPQALAIRFRSFMKKRDPEQDPLDMPLAVAAIIDSYIPKAKYHLQTIAPNCYPKCHCPNKPQKPSLITAASAGAQAAVTIQVSQPAAAHAAR